VFGFTRTYLKRRGKPYTDKEEQSVGHVVMMPRKRIPETNFKTADSPWIEWVWTIRSSVNMTSYLLKEHRYVRTDDLSTPIVFRSLPARQQQIKTHTVGIRRMRWGETRIAQGQGDIYQSRSFKIGTASSNNFQNRMENSRLSYSQRSTTTPSSYFVSTIKTGQVTKA
jgi:hypothetical protein